MRLGEGPCAGLGLSGPGESGPGPRWTGVGLGEASTWAVLRGLGLSDTLCPPTGPPGAPGGEVRGGGTGVWLVKLVERAGTGGVLELGSWLGRGPALGPDGRQESGEQRGEAFS